MKRYIAKLFKQEVTGKNKLGTPVVEDVEAGETIVRNAPVSPVLRETKGNDAHIVTRTFLTKQDAEQFQGVNGFEVQGHYYNLIDISKNDQGTLITGTYAKPGVTYEDEITS